jgi:hypothetical protein
MILCDLCGQAKDCEQRVIDGKDYDICGECWTPIGEKLKGKGRIRKERPVVFLPPTTKPAEPEQPKPVPPREPPKIWGTAGKPQ